MPAPSSTALFYFKAISDLASCANASLSWVYAGRSGQQFALVITNEGVAQEPPFSPGAISEVITPAVDPSLGSYSWSSVNVAPGCYKLNASFPQQSFSVSSTVFYVHSGTTTTCLLNADLPRTASSHTNVGAIVGGVLGAVAAFFLAAAIIYLLRKRMAKKPVSGFASASGPFPDDKKRRNLLYSPTSAWDYLGSVDSHMITPADARKFSQHHSNHSAAHKSLTDSVNLPVLDYSRDILRISLNGDEDKSPSGSVEAAESVLNAAARSSLPRFDPYAVPEQAHMQDSRRQDRTYATNLDRANSAHSSRRRLHSDTSSLAALSFTERASVYASAAPSPVPFAHSQTDIATKPTPVVDTSSNKPRKAARKPVPLYDAPVEPSSYPPASPQNTSPSSPTNTTHPLYQDDPFARPTPMLSTRASSGTLNGSNSLHSHYISRSQSNIAISRELAHKGSFGFEGRQMHYLIPDMPLPQKK